jgi:hypothetical protein
MGTDAGKPDSLRSSGNRSYADPADARDAAAVDADADPADTGDAAAVDAQAGRQSCVRYSRLGPATGLAFPGYSRQPHGSRGSTATTDPCGTAPGTGSPSGRRSAASRSPILPPVGAIRAGDPVRPASHGGRFATRGPAYVVPGRAVRAGPAAGRHGPIVRAGPAAGRDVAASRANSHGSTVHSCVPHGHSADRGVRAAPDPGCRRRSAATRNQPLPLERSQRESASPGAGTDLRHDHLLSAAA